MAFAVISDVHGNIDALEAVLADIARRGVNDIVNLGDCLSGPFDAAATADRLMALDIPTVSGNHDRWIYENPGAWEDWILDDLSVVHLDWVRSLPFSRMYQDRVFLCHASPSNDAENWLDYRSGTRVIARDLDAVVERTTDVDADLILCGHTHTPRSVRLPDGRRIVNPGSVGCPGYRDVRMTPNVIHQTGSPDARYALVTQIAGDYVVDLISVPYDASRMIEMARGKGALGWVEALQSGWFA